jgi:glycosyltransferase involved in cell wall biosynthesis
MNSTHSTGARTGKHIVLTVNAAWNTLNFRRTLLLALIEDGHRVTILAPPDKSVRQLEDLGCRFEPLDMSPSGLNPRDGISLLRGMRKSFRRQRPDVILSFTIKNNIFGALAAKSLGIPFIPNVTGLGTAFLSGKALERVAVLLYRMAFRNLPVVFFQNRDDRELFLWRKLVTANQARVLPGSGISLTHFPPTPLPDASEGTTFLMIGRLLRDKGVTEFAEAARMLKQSSRIGRFQLLGPLGSDNVSAVDAATVHGWIEEGIIEYLGETTDVRPHIAAAHCVVLPSYREGAPRTLLEAGAMAWPVIATDVPGCREVVDRDVSGLLCEARDGRSLADAMERFLNMSPAARQQMGLAGRQRMETHFDEARVISSYREVIASICKQRTQP